MVAAPDEQQAPKRQRLALLSHESASGGGDSAGLDRLESREPSDDEGEGEYEGEWSGSWEGCVDDLELSHEIYATQAVWEAR